MDVSFERVGFRYAVNTPFETEALHDVDVTMPSQSYTAIVGHTGSGKSTLLLHLNGLLKPTTGTVKIGDRVLTAGTKGKQLRTIRSEVGIVFQFPEHQLFEETVERDIMFGPMNFGVPEEEARRRAHELVDLLGLPEGTLEKSPFDLSGGQMRRVAIAGVLAFEPKVLVLDEPTAGLDPKGRKEMMELFYRLHQEKQLTTVLVTHSMEDAARYADQLVIMHEGTAVAQGPPEQLFADETLIESYRLDVPQSVHFQRQFEMKWDVSLPICLTEEQLAEEIARVLKRGEPNA